MLKALKEIKQNGKIMEYEKAFEVACGMVESMKEQAYIETCEAWDEPCERAERLERARALKNNAAMLESIIKLAKQAITMQAQDNEAE